MEEEQQERIGHQGGSPPLTQNEAAQWPHSPHEALPLHQEPDTVARGSLVDPSERAGFSQEAAPATEQD